MVAMIEGAEFFVILLVALVVLGPERLPEVARKVGRWSADLRRAARELREGLESEVGDIRSLAEDIRQPLREVEQTVRDTGNSMRSVSAEVDRELDSKPWVGPKPVSGPTPEDAMRDLEQINDSGRALDPTDEIEHRVTPKPWVGPKPLPPLEDESEDGAR
jgi:sec-independent protein translocase protein TatB